MKRTALGVLALVGVALTGLISLAPAAVAGDPGVQHSRAIDSMRFKVGASGQLYTWRSGSC